MNKMKAIKTLRIWDKNRKHVFTRHELRKLFAQDNDKAFSAGLSRLLEDNILQRVCRGIYINPEAMCSDGYTIEHIAKALRRGKYNYVSLESMLSEYGVISQIPVDRLTVMTTGREGTYKTPYGVIEYTHTKRSIVDIVKGLTTVENRPLRIATKMTAWRDLKRAGRNTNMVNLSELFNE